MDTKKFAVKTDRWVDSCHFHSKFSQHKRVFATDQWATDGGGRLTVSEQGHPLVDAISWRPSVVLVVSPALYRDTVAALFWLVAQ